MIKANIVYLRKFVMNVALHCTVCVMYIIQYESTFYYLFNCI